MLGIAGIALLAAWVLRDLPRFDRLTDYEPKLATHLQTLDGQEVGAFYHERRTVVPMERIPKLVRQAVLSAEDKDFYHRAGGVSATGILRSIFEAPHRRSHRRWQYHHPASGADLLAFAGAHPSPQAARAKCWPSASVPTSPRTRSSIST